MKKITRLSFFGLTLVFILASCSMEKRHYMSGYYISYHKVAKNEGKNIEMQGSTSKTEQAITIEPTEASGTENVNENPVTASTDRSIFIPAAHKINFSKKSVPVVTINSNATYKPSTIAKQIIQRASKQKSGGKPDKVLLYILCFIIPPIAVGLATDWDTNKVIFNILWTLLCGIPGIIHGIIVVSRS